LGNLASLPAQVADRFVRIGHAHRPGQSDPLAVAELGVSTLQVGVPWHPEGLLAVEPRHSGLFRAFLDACR
jgi:hypothetical protein